MNMPDFEDASPPHFQPDGAARNEPVGVFAAMKNAKEIFEGRWAGPRLRGDQERKRRELQDRQASREVADPVCPAPKHPRRATTTSGSMANLRPASFRCGPLGLQ